MLILAFLSGLMSLTAQILYQKIVAMIFGDLYSTFAMISLTFILGTALGGFFGPKLRRWLPHLEILGGVYSFAILFFLNALIAWNPPSWLVILALLPPAFIFGSHLPLYAYYFRQKNYSLIYGLYHWGPLLGLFGLEYYFTKAGSVSLALTLLGTLQTALGLFLFMQRKHFEIHYFQSEKALKLKSTLVTKSTLTVFAISTLSFMQISWAFKSQIFATEAFRLQSTMLVAAVFFWMALAGSLNRLFKTLPRSLHFLLWALALILIESTISSIPLLLTSHFNGQFANYFFISFCLAVFLTFPVFISSLLFIRETQTLSPLTDIDAASGFLNLFASFGNILGFLAASLLASWLWQPAYLGITLLLAVLIFFCLALGDFPLKKSYAFSGVATLLGLAMIFMNQDQAKLLIQNRVGAHERLQTELTIKHLRTTAFSNVVLASAQEKASTFEEPNLLYIVDGHLSHDLKNYHEVVVGLLGAKYFPTRLQKSVVIGIGTGQSAWGVQAISSETELVEISPAAIEALDFLADYNGQLQTKKQVRFVLQDGFNFLKNCPKHSYDLILNTSTYPGNFNASKLYSEEFVAQAKNCLSEKGVLESYFDAGTVQSQQQLADFLAPLKQHFRYVDIVLDPYPLVFAYNVDRPLRLVTADAIAQTEDRAFYTRLADKGLINLDQCQQILRHLPTLETPPQGLSRLDRSYIESNSIMNLVKSLKPGWQEVLLSAFLPSDLKPTCE